MNNSHSILRTTSRMGFPDRNAQGFSQKIPRKHSSLSKRIANCNLEGSFSAQSTSSEVIQDLSCGLRAMIALNNCLNQSWSQKKIRGSGDTPLYGSGGAQPEWGVPLTTLLNLSERWTTSRYTKNTQPAQLIVTVISLPRGIYPQGMTVHYPNPFLITSEIGFVRNLVRKRMNTQTQIMRCDTNLFKRKHIEQSNFSLQEPEY